MTVCFQTDLIAFYTELCFFLIAEYSVFLAVWHHQRALFGFIVLLVETDIQWMIFFIIIKLQFLCNKLNITKNIFLIVNLTFQSIKFNDILTQWRYYFTGVTTCNCCNIYCWCDDWWSFCCSIDSKFLCFNIGVCS